MQSKLHPKQMQDGAHKKRHPNLPDMHSNIGIPKCCTSWQNAVEHHTCCTIAPSTRTGHLHCLLLVPATIANNQQRKHHCQHAYDTRASMLPHVCAQHVHTTTTVHFPSQHHQRSAFSGLKTPSCMYVIDPSIDPLYPHPKEQQDEANDQAHHIKPRSHFLPSCHSETTDMSGKTPCVARCAGNKKGHPQRMVPRFLCPRSNSTKCPFGMKAFKYFRKPSSTILSPLLCSQPVPQGRTKLICARVRPHPVAQAKSHSPKLRPSLSCSYRSIHPAPISRDISPHLYTQKQTSKSHPSLIPSKATEPIRSD